jgi:hypothetical protein
MTSRIIIIERSGVTLMPKQVQLAQLHAMEIESGKVLLHSRAPYVENIQRVQTEKHYEATKADYPTRQGKFMNWWQHYSNGFILDRTPGIVSGGRGKIAGYDPINLQYSCGLVPLFN